MSPRDSTSVDRTTSFPSSSLAGAGVGIGLRLLVLSSPLRDLTNSIIFSSSPVTSLTSDRSREGVRFRGREELTLFSDPRCRLHTWAQALMNMVAVFPSKTAWCTAKPMENPWLGNSVICRE